MVTFDIQGACLAASLRHLSSCSKHNQFNFTAVVFPRMEDRRYWRWMSFSLQKWRTAVQVSYLQSHPLLFSNYSFCHSISRAEYLGLNDIKVTEKSTGITSNIPWNLISRAPFNFETKAFSSCHDSFLAEWIFFFSSCGSDLLPLLKCHGVCSCP